jgi:hypothetical protein
MGKPTSQNHIYFEFESWLPNSNLKIGFPANYVGYWWHIGPGPSFTIVELRYGGVVV